MQKLRLNDEVVILAGKDKGKSGKLKMLNFKKSTAVVEGVNIVKKAVKPTQESPAGGIVEKEASIHISNIALKSPKDGKASRVRIESRDGKNVRVATSCGSVLK